MAYTPNNKSLTMITKEQFLAGVEFRVKGVANQHRYCTKALCLTNKPFREFLYCANVKNVDDSGFGFYTYVLNEFVQGRVMFSDCTAIVNEPKEAIV